MWGVGDGGRGQQEIHIECLPITQEVAGSNDVESQPLFFASCLLWVHALALLSHSHVYTSVHNSGQAPGLCETLSSFICAGVSFT